MDFPHSQCSDSRPVGPSIAESDRQGIAKSHAGVPLTYLTAIYSSLLVASVAGGAKVVGLPFGMAASATVFSYAITFALTDVISEVYGEKAAKNAVVVGFASMAIAVLFFEIAISAPAADGWGGQEAYHQTLHQARRILLGGWAAFLVSQHLDVWLFHRIRNLTNGRHLWLRNNTSTLVSQFFDTLIFIYVAFSGVFPLRGLMAGQYSVKILIAVLDTAPVYWAVRIVRKLSGREEL